MLWQFGPRRQTELWTQLLAGLDGGPDGARAAELALRRGRYRAASLPEVPDSTVLFSHDALGEACDYAAMRAEVLADLAPGGAFSPPDVGLSWLDWPDVDLSGLFDWFDFGP